MRHSDRTKTRTKTDTYELRQTTKPYTINKDTKLLWPQYNYHIQKRAQHINLYFYFISPFCHDIAICILQPNPSHCNFYVLKTLSHTTQPLLLVNFD